MKLLLSEWINNILLELHLYHLREAGILENAVITNHINTNKQVKTLYFSYLCLNSIIPRLFRTFVLAGHNSRLGCGDYKSYKHKQES